jgi:hypothetical protein
MQTHAKEAYVTAVAYHRARLAAASEPKSAGDRTAACFKEWLSIAQFLHWMEKAVIPNVPRAVKASMDFEYFRTLDPTASRRVIAQGSDGSWSLKFFSPQPKLLDELVFRSLAEWDEAKDQLEEYRPLVDFHEVTVKITLEMRKAVELEIQQGLDLPRNRGNSD